MATYVLVHGAWSGAHCFAKVRRLLQHDGHQVLTPSLTGIGERAHLTGPQVDLSTHVWDVSNAVLYEDLSEVVLLGFSYGGMVVSGAMTHLADRVTELVFLDAFVPADGESLADLADLTGTGGAGGGLVGLGNDWLVPPLPRDYEDPADVEQANARRVPHPVGCFLEPVALPRPLEELDVGLTYIKATGEPRPEGGGAFWDADDRARSSARWRRFEIATDHMVPYNRPHELAEVLRQVAPTG